jgi:hypothetical protein
MAGAFLVQAILIAVVGGVSVFGSDLVFWFPGLLWIVTVNGLSGILYALYYGFQLFTSNKMTLWWALYFGRRYRMYYCSHVCTLPS